MDQVITKIFGTFIENTNLSLIFRYNTGFSILIVVLITSDWLLTFYYFMLSNRFSTIEKISWKLGLLLFILSVIGRSFFVIFVVTLLYQYKIQIQGFWLIISVLLAILLLVLPTIVILRSVANFMINRVHPSDSEKRLLFFLNAFSISLSTITIYILILPLISIGIYHSWKDDILSEARVDFMVDRAVGD